MKNDAVDTENAKPTTKKTKDRQNAYMDELSRLGDACAAGEVKCTVKIVLVDAMVCLPEVGHGEQRHWNALAGGRWDILNNDTGDALAGGRWDILNNDKLVNAMVCLLKMKTFEATTWCHDNKIQIGRTWSNWPSGPEICAGEDRKEDKVELDKIFNCFRRFDKWKIL